MLRSLLVGKKRARGWRSAVATLRRTLDYEVRVFTGDRRGAGTTANVFISLKGKDDETEDQYLLGGRFERNSVDRFLISTPYDLGEIRSIAIGTDDAGEDERWFLDKIEVNGRPFVCRNWIGSGASGARVHILTPFEVSASTRTARSKSHTTQRLQLVTGAVTLPHPDKRRQGHRAVVKRDFGWAGEDAYFAIGNHTLNPAMGVADGVHEWREKGVDAGVISKTILRTAREIIGSVGAEGQLLPENVLREAYARIMEIRVKGSCTVCMCILDSAEQTLHTVNIGDSGILVYGSWDGNNKPREIYRSPPQEHSFGYPYQLGHHQASDSPDDAEVDKVVVREHDLIICGSDGLLDNLNESEMLTIVQNVANGPEKNRRKQTQLVAQQLASAAYDNSLSKTKVTPYSEAASDEFQMVFRGGKPDDITVVAGFVQNVPAK